MYPKSQQELIRTARGDQTQAQFAQVLGVDRSCLSRYESEVLGAPTSVINYCLALLTQRMEHDAGDAWPVSDALTHARETVAALERMAGEVHQKSAPGARQPRRRSK